MKWKWWKKFLLGMILYPLIKSNTLIKVPCLTDCDVSQNFFWPLSLQRFKHLSQYGHTLQWDFGDGATDIDTLRVVNQDVKREISKILIEVHTYCRIILINTPYMSKQVEILSWIKMSYTKGNSIFRSNMKSMNFPPEFKIFNNNLHNRLYFTF